MKRWIKSNIFPFIREDLLRGMPIPGEHPNYARAFIRWYPLIQLRVDIIAGFAMAFSIIPDVVAFATIAQVPATMCLYGTFWLCLIACIFGGQPGLISGTSAALILIQGNLLRESQGDYFLLSCTLILVGILQISFGTLKLSGLLEIISLPTMKGYCSGLALLLFYSQLKGFKEPAEYGYFGPPNSFLFENENSTVMQYFSNQSTIDITSSGLLSNHSFFIEDIILNTEKYLVTFKVNETTSQISNIPVLIDDFATLLNITGTRLRLEPENIGSFHFIHLYITEYTEKLVYLTGEKLIFAICISLFVLATIQLGVMLIEIFPFSFLALLIACIAIYESGLKFNNNSSPMLRLLLPRVPYMEFSLTNIIIVIKYALSLTFIGLLESMNAIHAFDSFDSEEKSHNISISEETEFELIQYSYDTFSRQFDTTASKTRTKPYFGQPHKECVAQGLGNLMCGFFGTMGGCVLLEQSIINYKCGSRSRVSALIAAIFILLVVEYFQYEIDRIPNIALIGIIFSCVINRIAWDTVNILRNSFQFKNRFAYTASVVVFVVMTISFFWGLEYGLLVGILIESVSYLYSSKKEFLGKKEKFEIMKKKFMGDFLIVYYFKGPLFFFSSQQFRNNFIFHHNKYDNFSIVFDFTEVLLYDYTSVVTLCDIVNQINLQGQHIQIHGLNEKNISMIKSSGKYELLKGAIKFPNIHVGSFLVRYYEPTKPVKWPLIVDIIITILINTKRCRGLLSCFRLYSEKYQDDYINCIQIGQVLPETVKVHPFSSDFGSDYSYLHGEGDDMNGDNRPKYIYNNMNHPHHQHRNNNNNNNNNNNHNHHHHHHHHPREVFASYTVVKWKFVTDFDFDELSGTNELIGFHSLRKEDQAYLNSWFT